METDGMASKPNATLKSASDRDLLALLAVGFYALFTLLPDSSSLVVAWPWVFLWQVGLLLPWLWLLKQGWSKRLFVRLGYGLDYGVGLAAFSLFAATVFARFPQQARWYSWAALCAIAALYALNAWCSTPQRRQTLLTAQGGLSLAFIVTSLSLWTVQTWLPELNRLAALKALGLERSFDFSILELRNWAPIGHQNYVAGFLVLSIPLLVGLCWQAPMPWKGLWGLGTILGCVALYTTSSRGGWLGLALVAITGILFFLRQNHLSRRWRGLIGIGLVLGCMLTVLANNRLRALFGNVFSSDGVGGETAFRWITNATGWDMGLAHPLFGAGPGSVPLLYQSYRPAWAGREAELVYQLHSTPAQIWAELGACGIALGCVLVGWLGFRGRKLWGALPDPLAGDRILTWSLLAGLSGYGIVALTDYQLDIPCISGTLILYFVCLLSLLRQYLPQPRSPQVQSAKVIWGCWGLVGLLVAVGIWLTPIHRAWQLSSIGFAALAQKQIEPFTTALEQAHRLTPWEPYYSYQLGWNLGIARSDDATVNRARAAQSLDFFQRNVQASPYQEAGNSSLGWQQLFHRQFSQATQSFGQATQLMPAKRGAFYSLGQSLLAQNQPKLAVQAIALEIVRDPLFLTSPLLQTEPVATVYPQVQAEVVRLYQALLDKRAAQEPLTAHLHQCLSGIYWWQGDVAAASNQWRKHGIPLGAAVISVSQNKAIPTDVPILKAWQEPQQRNQWIEQAILQATQAPPNPTEVQTIATGMARSKSFDQWVKQNAPLRQYPRERAGFGVLSRHIDGPAPFDFFPVTENVATTQFLADLFPSPSYSPALDMALQPFRESLWQALKIAATTPSKSG
jgi:uncharacterized protein involved in response to NO